MATSVFDALQKAVKLLAYFCVETIEVRQSSAFKIITTLMRNTVEHVVPKSRFFKVCRFTVHTILTEGASKVIKDLFGGSTFIAKQRVKRVFSSLSTVYDVKSVAMAMDGAEPQEQMSPSTMRHLPKMFLATTGVRIIVKDLACRIYVIVRDMSLHIARW